MTYDFFDIVPSAIAVHAFDGRILYANRKYLDIHGYTKDEFLGLGLDRINVPESAALIAERMKALEENGENVFEVGHFRKDGGIIRLEVVSRIVELVSNRVVLSAVTDITDRKREEETLRSLAESDFAPGEDVFKAMVKQLALSQGVRYALIALIDPENQAAATTIAVWAGDRFGENFSYTLDGTPCRNVTERDTCFYPCNIQELFPEDHLLVKLAAQSYWGTPLKDSAGKILGTMAILDDKAMEGRTQVLLLLKSFASRASSELERKAAEDAMRSSEEKLKSVFRAAPVGIGVVANRVITEANAFLCGMLGYAREELVGSSSRLIYQSQEEFEFVGREKYRQIAERGIGTVETTWRRKDGKLIEVLLSSTPIYGMDLSRGVTFTAVDMTERSKLQAQLSQARKMEAVGRLAGGVAHDFNNMLGAIMGHAEMALDKLGSDRSPRQNLEEILKASKRSADLTRQLLAFARKQAVSPVALDPNQAIDSMLSMLRRLIGENIDLTWNPAPAPWPIRIDPSQLDQIMANLCVNARDAIGGPGAVEIETSNRSLDADYVALHPGSQTGDFLRISVSDNGKGMDAQVMEHLFEPFFTTKELGRGTGLGLATVYGIVKQNKGLIEVSSAPLRGTRIEIFLPRHDTAPASPAALPLQTAKGRGERVLLVEDEALLRDLCADMLRALGYEAMVAASPHEALALAESSGKGIDLLVTDLVMPGMNGRELALKIAEKYPRAGILFMSGYTADLIADQGVLEQDLQFIQKPFSIADFSVKLRETLRK